MEPSVALTPEGLAAALKLEAEGVDVRRLVSAELVHQAAIGGDLATYARRKGLQVRTTYDPDGQFSIVVVSDGRGGCWDLHRARVRMSFRRQLDRRAPVKVSVALIDNGDESKNPTVAMMPDSAMSPAEWIAFAESLVREQADAWYVEHAERIANAKREARNDSMGLL